MSRYSSDNRRSTVVDSDSEYYSREHRGRHRSRGPAVLDRPPRRTAEDLRWDARLQETDRYGPPARRSSRHYEDDHLHHGSLVRHERRHAESPPPRPRLLRRQSSLDTFDRLPSRKIDEYYRGYLPRGAPSPPPPRSRSRRFDMDEWEEVRIPEPDLKPYPRKGKTRMPRKLVHTRAIREFGYPYEEEGDLVIIQLALSKDQIDDIIGRSREIKRQSETLAIPRARSPIRASSRRRTVERIAMESYSPSPRASGTLIIERSPSRHRSPSRGHYDYSEKKTTRTVSRARSISVHRPRRHSSPVRMLIQPRDERSEDTGQLAVVVRPRHSDDDILDYPVERRSGRTLIRETDLVGDGEMEEALEVKRKRRGPSARTLRAMLATMT